MNANEERLLTKYKKQLERITVPGYLVYMLFILSMVYIIDEITSNIYNSLQSDMITEFFVNGMGLEFNTGLATYSAMTAPLYAIMLITPFYKSLADKFGRKLFLALNTFGMGVGMFVCMLAPNPVIYICGIGIIYFLMNNDMQVLYVMESAPEKHRAKLTSLTKAIALLGVTFIPILRDVFMKNDGSQWQKVFMIPAIAGMIMGIVAFFIMPETPAYLKRKIAYLELPESERKALEENKKKSSEDSDGGVVAALSGFITDILGRKRSAAVLAGTALVGLVSFVLCAGAASPILVGVSYGLFIGGLWSAADILFIMLPGESTPTNLRVSVVGTMGIMSGVGNVLSIAIMTVGMLFVENIGILCLCVCVPFLLTAIIILLTKVNETKGVDLSKVTGSEWD